MRQMTRDTEEMDFGVVGKVKKWPLLSESSVRQYGRQGQETALCSRAARCSVVSKVNKPLICRNLTGHCDNIRRVDK